MSIVLRNITKIIGNRTILNKIDLAVSRGEVVGLMGPNGAGKTTIMRIIAGIIPPTSGVVELLGKPILSFQEHNKMKNFIGFLPETAVLYKKLTAFEFVRLIGTLRGMSEDAIEKKTQYYFNYLKFRNEDSLLEELSRGMQQKVLLTATLIHDPPIILLDEPIATLDVYSAFLVKKLIRQLAAENRVIVVASHIPALIKDICDRIHLIIAGEIKDTVVLRQKDQKENLDLEQWYINKIVRMET